MVTLKNEFRIPDPVPLHELDHGVFFEFSNEIYQLLSWSNDEEQYNCLKLSNMNYVNFECDELVHPVDVEITVTGYTKKDC